MTRRSTSARTLRERCSVRTVSCRLTAASAVAMGAAILPLHGAHAQAPTAPPAATAPAPAASAPAAPPKWYDRIGVSGSLDTYYDYNTNSPKGQVNQLQNFTFNANQFAVPLAELVLSETPDAATSPFGWKIVLGYGNEANAIPGPTDVPAYNNLIQAYGTYIANGKSSAPITINFGKFVTWTGQEVIESQGNWNYTHSLLFAWAIPYYHAGISVGRPFGSKLNATLYLVNGWNDVVDNNNGKSVGYGLSYTFSPKLSFITNALYGPELPGDEHDYRFLTDNILTFSPSSKLTLVGNYDYGSDKNAPGGGRSHWSGLAAYAHYLLSPKTAGTVRAEIFGDPTGSQTGTAGEYKEATLTYEYRVHPRIITRFEVREDWGAKAFTTGAGANMKNSQTQFVIGNIFTF